MAAGPIQERNQDATVYVGGLDEKVTESVIWELFVQAGPVVSCHMPKDRISGAHQGYGFVEFLGEEDADYAIKIMNMIKLYGKPVRVNKASAHQKNLDVGANIFIGNLDSEVDEKLLYDTFSAFGVILQVPKIMRDPESGNSKGFAFVNFANFEASDASIEAMNGQYLCNRPISVTYAFKKDIKGERHGSAAERLLAAQNPLAYAAAPNQLFADAPPSNVSLAATNVSSTMVPSAPQSIPLGMHMTPGSMGVPMGNAGYPLSGPPGSVSTPRMPPMQPPPRPPQMPGPPPPPPGMMQQMGNLSGRPQFPPPPGSRFGGYGQQQPGGQNQMGGGPGPPLPPYRGPPMPPVSQQQQGTLRGPPPPGYHQQNMYGGGPPRPPPPGFRQPLMRGVPPPPGSGMVPPRPPLPPQTSMN